MKPRFEAQLEVIAPSQILTEALDDVMEDYRRGIVFEEEAFDMVDRLTIRIDSPDAKELQMRYNSIICAISEELYWGGGFGYDFF